MAAVPAGTTTDVRAQASPTRRARPAAAGLALACAAAVAATAVPTMARTTDVPAPAEPQVSLACEMDACTVEVSYLTPLRRDGHDVTFVWRTSAAAGYPGNRSDDVRRSRTSGVGQPTDTAQPRGYRYTVHDFIWHSDIRCDRQVTVTVAGRAIGERTRTVTKSVPDRPHDAYCSDYGMAGETAGSSTVRRRGDPSPRARP